MHVGATRSAAAYSVCASTTPDTALIAPAICGATLNRPESGLENEHVALPPLVDLGRSVGAGPNRLQVTILTLPSINP